MRSIGGDEGCSRGGLKTKIYALFDADGRPIAMKLTKCQAHDGRSADDMFEAVRKGKILIAYSAYVSKERREMLAKRGAWANIKPLTNRKAKLALSAYIYRHRNLVERFFNKATHLSSVARRYDKRVDNFRALIRLASPRIWLLAHRSMS